MKEEMMQRLLNLAERTGDRVIVTDPAGEHPYVLMSLDQYERLMADRAPAAPLTAPAPAPAPKMEAPTPAPAPVSAPNEALASVLRQEAVTAPVFPSVRPPAKPALFEPAPAARRPSPPPARPAPRREIPLWVPPEPAKTEPPVKATVSVLAEIEPEPEGEEQFYLEPLE